MINWISDQSGDSVVRYGRTENYGEVRVANNSTLHHVEIPIEELDGVYNYPVQTGNQSSENATFKAYPKDELRSSCRHRYICLDLNATAGDDRIYCLRRAITLKHSRCLWSRKQNMRR